MVSFWPWGNDDTSPASFEKTLSALSSKIASTQTTLDRTRARARRVKVLLVLYLGFAYLAYAVVQLVVVKYWNMGALEWVGMAMGPVLITLTRKLVGAYLNFRTEILGRRLKDQQEERTKTIQKLKDATRYDSTMELIEKYGGGKKNEAPRSDGKRKGGDKQSQQPDARNGATERTRLPPPPTANIKPRTAEPPASGPSPPGPNSLEAGAEFAPNAFTHHPPPPLRDQQSAPYATGPADSHWYDRIFDVLLGEDETLPKNRIVLLCQSCRLINGQAPPGTRNLAELGVWRCMGCHAMNGTVDEAKRIVDEALASSQQIVEEEVNVPVENEEGYEAVNVSGAGEKVSSATGAESHDGAKQRRGKNK
ncbi:hypothetical protein LLEC1_04140 [Akanthomyces lecanii]|uniref:Endoplasmic reticulum junction formation protein lunapark n=1 Tax=Cordyceps confragosa TaxID=2714763 RepID=A0A179I5F9_CORDF|nr:hypothetical protein LLEC1_04140 [Akanthomyces lecanii]